MENLIKDARFAVRTLARQRAFTATALATLAIAIGASTAIFSIVEATILRPLPFKAPERLAFAWGVAGPERAIRGASFVEAQDWGRLNRAFQRFTTYDETSLNLLGTDGAERIDAEMVSPAYFEMLGATAHLGRTFTADEDAVPNAAPVVTISHRLWRQRFGADPDIVGRSLTLNERPFTVVGVMQPGFHGLSFDTEIWFPTMMVQANGGPTNLQSRGSRWLGAVGELREGVTVEQAQKDMDRVAAQLTRDFPESNTDRGVQLFELRDQYLGTTERMLWFVFGAVGLLLVIACSNVLALQLVRASSRGREIALRIAVGANRVRLVQQLVVEGLVLSFFAAVIGILVGYWALQGLLLLVPAGLLPSYAAPSLNLWTFLFAGAVTLGCGMLFGLIPALSASRVDLVDSLKEGTRSTSGGFGRRLGGQHLLVIGEAAVALVILIGAGLFVRSLQRELSVNPGFAASEMLAARLLVPRQYDPPARVQLAERLRQRIAALPSVSAVAVGSDMPLSGATSASFIFVPEGEQRVRYYRHSVMPGYFEALGMRIVEGRPITADDRDGTLSVAVMNESAARRFWPGQSAVGKRFHYGDRDGEIVTIVGVVADVRYRDLTTPLGNSEPDVFYSYAQLPAGGIHLAVRSRIAPENLANTVRREVAGIDPAIALFNLAAMEETLAQQTARGRFASSVLTVFGAAALLLTAVGLYGVLAYLVTLRRREIGIRLALGATRSTVQRSIVRYGVVLIAVGMTVGIVVASGVTRWIASQLFGISAHDPVVFVGVPAILLFVAVAASWLPARRASRVDPQTTLRME